MKIVVNGFLLSLIVKDTSIRMYRMSLDGRRGSHEEILRLTLLIGIAI
jgi:hypothetical protein